MSRYTEKPERRSGVEEKALSERLRNTKAVIMERFEEQLDQVLQNIADVNTKLIAVREINQKVKIRPQMTESP